LEIGGPQSAPFPVHVPCLTAQFVDDLLLFANFIQQILPGQRFAGGIHSACSRRLLILLIVVPVHFTANFRAFLIIF
jgi:hypothetical protein